MPFLKRLLQDRVLEFIQGDLEITRGFSSGHSRSYARRRNLTADNSLQSSDNRGYICLALASCRNILHHGFKGIQAFEQGVKNKILHPQFIIAHQVEHIFHLVGKRCQILKPHCSRHTL
ncbi:hypothetical protein D3C80_1036560 [compost metagenome]